jgi:hypothetical protein
MRRLLAFLFIGAAILACSKPDNDPVDDPVTPDEQPSKPVTGTEVGGIQGIIANANMEADVNVQAQDKAFAGNWSYFGVWHAYNAHAYQSDDKGYGNSRCLVIHADQTTDVGFRQVIKVEPGTAYTITARVKAEKVSGGAGAHLSLDYLWAPKSPAVVGTTGWTTTSLDIEPTTDEVTLCLKLGNTAGDCSGTAYFDNVSIRVNNNLYVKESDHIRLILDKYQLSVSDELIEQWLENLDNAYESMQELFLGKIPYENDCMTIRATPELDAWAYAGNPIRWNSKYISSTLKQLENGDWVFGILHEIGHNFGPSRFGATTAWNFNEELFANFRMYYALYHLDATIVQNAKIYNSDGTYKTVEKSYVGREIKQLYKSECDNGYDMTIAKNRAVEMGNAICYCLCRMVDKYGWQVWIDTFEYLYNISSTEKPATGMNAWQKFEYLMDALTMHNTEDVRNSFTASELAVIKAYLSTQT